MITLSRLQNSWVANVSIYIQSPSSVQIYPFSAPPTVPLLYLVLFGILSAVTVYQYWGGGALKMLYEQGGSLRSPVQFAFILSYSYSAVILKNRVLIMYTPHHAWCFIISIVWHVHILHPNWAYKCWPNQSAIHARVCSPCISPCNGMCTWGQLRIQEEDLLPLWQQILGYLLLVQIA